MDNSNKRFQIVKTTRNATGLVTAEQMAASNDQDTAFEIFAAAANEIRRERPAGEVVLFDRGQRAAGYVK